MIYLDHNATTPLLGEARDAMLPWLGTCANASSAHSLGRAAAIAVDRARQQVAELVGWPRDGVVFTSGATEANALALTMGTWAASAVEHPSVLAWATRVLPVDEHGVVQLQTEPGIDETDAPIYGISIQLANNETGVLQPISEIAASAHGRGWLLHVDAAQAPGRVGLGSLALADLVSLSAHKLGGPQGVGALLVRPGNDARPILRGGPQERGWRAGTLNVAGIVGFGVAAQRACGQVAPSGLRDKLQAAAILLGGRVASGGADRLPNTLAVGFDGIDAADLVVALDLAGVCASAGSACASGSPRPSHVLRAMHFPGGAVRFSLGPATTEREVDTTILALTAALERMRAPA